MSRKATKRATVGWYVEARLDGDAPEQKPHAISRLFHSKEAADSFAELARSQLTRWPETVLVRTRLKVDKIPDFA